jgi:MerR family transcriptional regulator, light-induced transcriptional regulator
MSDRSSEAGVGIAAVERDTGINKETLRVWERRYGFPQPRRDAAGERLYPPEQVQRLRLVRRLLDAGHRPGRVVPALPQELAALLQPAAAAPALVDAAPEVAACLALLRAHEVDRLRHALAQAVLRRGLAAAVVEVFAPLTTQVGELCMSGALQVFEERLCAELLQRELCQAIRALPQPVLPGPRVLLATLPGESQALGLLMAEALLGLDGAACLSLGPQLPVAELPAAAALHRAEVVALGVCGQLPSRATLDGLSDLRRLLPAGLEIWAVSGHRLPRPAGCPEGVRWLESLAAITAETQRRRELLESGL